MVQKSFLKSKTFWVSALTIFASLLMQFTGVDITTGVDGTTIGMILGIVFMVLRFATGVSIVIEDIPSQKITQ